MIYMIRMKLLNQKFNKDGFYGMIICFSIGVFLLI
ncbi:unnamed protein product, partial [marine sediment metagenome]